MLYAVLILPPSYFSTSYSGILGYEYPLGTALFIAGIDHDSQQVPSKSVIVRELFSPPPTDLSHQTLAPFVRIWALFVVPNVGDAFSTCS